MSQAIRMVARHAAPVLAVGDRVPDVVYDAGGVRIHRRSLVGRPFVMVTSSQSRAAARGATALLVLSAERDELQEAEDPARCVGLFGADGEPDPIPQNHVLTFYVVDVYGVIREIHVEHAGPYRAFNGLGSLRAGLRALSVPPFARKALWARRDAVMMQLVGTLATLAIEEPPTVRSPRESGTSFRVPDAAEVAELVRAGLTSCTEDEIEGGGETERGKTPQVANTPRSCAPGPCEISGKFKLVSWHPVCGVRSS